jgi:hypothetical protein
MILRVSVLFLVIMASFYVFFNLAFNSPYFKNKERIKRIARRTLFTLISIAATALVIGFISSVDNSI